VISSRALRFCRLGAAVIASFDGALRFLGPWLASDKGVAFAGFSKSPSEVSKVVTSVGAGGWRLDAGGWRLDAGGWRLDAGASNFGTPLGTGGSRHDSGMAGVAG
jgi:hypothetical protein